MSRRFTFNFRATLTVRKTTERLHHRQKLLRLFDALAHLLQHGYSLRIALQFLLMSDRNSSVQKLLNIAAAAVESGQQLSHCWQRFLPPSYVAVLRAGEEAGRIGESLAICCDYDAEERDRRKRLIRVFSYPTVLLVMLFALVCILSAVMIPIYEQMYAGIGIPLPSETQVIFQSIALVPNLFLMAVFCIGCAITVALGIHRFRPDLWALFSPKLPFYRYVWKLRTERFCRLLYLLVSCGIPIVSAVSLLADAGGPTWLRARCRELHRRLLAGDTVSEALGDEWDPLLSLDMSLAEGTGEIAWALQRCGRQLGEQLQRRVDGWVKWLEPGLLLAVGVVVTLVMFSVFVPMYDLASSLSQPAA